MASSGCGGIPGAEALERTRENRHLRDMRPHLTNLARALPRALTLAAALIVGACARGADANSDVIRADSAGVLIMTSGARDTTLPWKFEEIDVLRDTLGEPYLFNNVLRFMVLVDRAGRTYVLTRDPSIVRFGRDGKQDLVVGRRGGGPGEFELPVAIGSQGDTIWVQDLMKQSLVRFTPELEPTTDRRLEGALSRAQMLYFRTGGLWYRSVQYKDGVAHTSVRADTMGGSPLASVASLPLRPVDYGCIQIQGMPPIFDPQIAMSASVARLLVHAQPNYELWLYEGPRAVGSIRRPLTPRAPTVEDVRVQYPEGMRFGTGAGAARCVAPVEQIVEQQGVAPLMPFIFDVALLSDGTMWALRTPHEAPPAVDVFGPDGIYAGTMTGRALPLARLPNGELLFAKRDEDTGGTHIVRVRILR